MHHFTSLRADASTTDQHTSGNVDKESGNDARAHTLLFGLHTMNFFFLDYDDANIALGVIHNMEFFCFGVAQSGLHGIATAEHTAAARRAHLLLSPGKGGKSIRAVHTLHFGTRSGSERRLASL
jgi:hypothetical protein